MPFLELDDVRLHWREDGDPDGTPIVFANSLGTDTRLWDDLLPHLPARARKIRFDLRGHGRSGCPPSPYSLDDLTGDVVALLESLGIKGCTFVGTSLGGMIAQNIAVARPDLVDRLVLTNTAPKMGDPAMWAARVDAVRRDGLASISEDILARWFGPVFLADSRLNDWRKILIETSAEGYVGCCQAIAAADLTANLGNIQQKTLVIGGADDRASPPDQIRDMASRITHSTCHILDDVGHLPSIEAPAILAYHIVEGIDEDRDV